MYKWNMGNWTMRKRWVKIGAALAIALGSSFLLTKTVLYPTAPVVRNDFLIKTDILLARAKDRLSGYGNEEESQTMPPPYFFSPVPGFSRPKTPEEKQNNSPAGPRPTKELVYPTQKPYPTYNPIKKITPVPPPENNVSPPEQEPIFNPPTQAPTQPPGSPSSSSASQLLTLINQQREKEGAGRLVFNSSLNKAAQVHADTTPGCGHYGPDGETPFDRATAAGYPSPWVGENIACRVNSAQRAFELWMNSPPHHDNIVNKDWKSAGIGIARGYWVFVGGAI
ncbi:MAG: CAP domain-containing protein [Nitrospinota bacterium]